MSMDELNGSKKGAFFFTIGALALIAVLLASSITLAENSIIEQREKEILSLAADPTKDFLWFDAFEKTSDLPVDDAIALYTSLIDYDLFDAHSTEVLLELTTKIGDKIVPFLVKKKDSPLACLDEYKSICSNTDERDKLIDEILGDIRRGSIAYAEYPENLSIESEKGLDIVEIFLRDYKLKFGRLPKNLVALRDYAWNAYGYKLKIYTPWGNQLTVYKRSEKGYKLEIYDPWDRLIVYSENGRRRLVGLEIDTEINASLPLTHAKAFGENSVVSQKEAEILSFFENGNFPKLEDALEKTNDLSIDDKIALYTSLMDYYLGEVPGEVLHEKITKLGDNVVPSLIKKKDSPSNCLDKKKGPCLSVNIRNELINEMLEAISRGVGLYSEAPGNLGLETGKQLDIIDIFIEDYKGKFGKLPKDLAFLREYEWIAYGYKLIIYNPWDVPIPYKPGENGQTYSIDPGSDIDIKDLPSLLPANVNQTNTSETALMIAAYSGDKILVKLLLANGADVNLKDHSGMTALMDAARFGYYEIVQLLMAHDADINAKNNKGETALTLATSLGYKKIVRLLRQAGAKE